MPTVDSLHRRPLFQQGRIRSGMGGLRNEGHLMKMSLVKHHGRLHWEDLVSLFPDRISWRYNWSCVQEGIGSWPCSPSFFYFRDGQTLLSQWRALTPLTWPPVAGHRGFRGPAKTSVSYSGGTNCMTKSHHYLVPSWKNTALLFDYVFKLIQGNNWHSQPT